jgi:hypothetical protein
MPLATHLLLKYSDVLADPVLGNGSRSPRNYYEQLLRCATEIAVNVFATVNNRLILDRLGPVDHRSLESQFISDSIERLFGVTGYERCKFRPLSVVTEFAAVREHNTPKAASERAALTRPCATPHARQCVY